MIGLPGDYISVPETEENKTEAKELPPLMLLFGPHQGTICRCSIYDQCVNSLRCKSAIE